MRRPPFTKLKNWGRHLRSKIGINFKFNSHQYRKQICTIWAKKISIPAVQEVMDKALGHNRPTAINCYEKANKVKAGSMVSRMVDYTLVSELHKSYLIFVLVYFEKIAINDDVHLRLNNICLARWPPASPRRISTLRSRKCRWADFPDFLTILIGYLAFHCFQGWKQHSVNYGPAHFKQHKQQT